MGILICKMAKSIRLNKVSRKRLRMIIRKLEGDILPTLKHRVSNGLNSYELVVPNVVPDSSTTAFRKEGLTLCPKTLSSGQSALTKIL